MTVRIDESWRQALSAEWDKPYFVQLTQWVREQYRAGLVFPPGRQIFAAFDATPFDQVKVVILGQDPYHGDGQANGLCFSVNPGVAFPPSLLNIFKEVHDDTGAPMPKDGDLTRWARRPPSRPAPEPRLGTVHRRGDSAPGHAARAPGVHLVGQLCCAQRSVHRPHAPSRAHLAASLAAVGPQRLLWQPSLLACQRLSRGPWPATYCVVSDILVIL